MVEQTVSRPFIGSPSPLPWSHRAATKLFYACRRWQLGGKDRFQEHEHSNVDATRPHNSLVSPPITLVCIADTHNSRPELPHGDILLHAGDLSQYGTFDEVQAQLYWLNSHPHQHKIIIAGNHDLLLDSTFVQSHPDRELDCHPGKRRSDLDWGDVHYLQHSSVSVEVSTGMTSRLLNIFGSPWTPRMGSWAFQYGPDSGFAWEGAIPHDADVVLVHGPPAQHLDDGGKGCPNLLTELWRVRPRVAICGHIHAGRGHELLVYDDVQELYEDVTLGRSDWMSSLLLLGVHTAWRAMRHMKKAVKDTLSGTSNKDEETQVKSTWLVNAAIAGSHGQVHINALQHNRELKIYRHLQSPALEQSEHGRKEHLRELYEFLRIEGPYGTHNVLVLRPLGTAIRDLRKAMPDGVFDAEIVPDILLEILPTIHFLHTEANITHTDIHTGNLLEGIQDEQLLV